MDDRDLQLLRAFRASEAEPPDGLQARIEERLWQSILAEEAARSPRTRAQRSWFQRMSRPLVAAGAAATLAIGVAVASDGGGSSSTLGQAGVVQAGSGVFDSTARSLFGGTTTASSPITGRVDLSSGDERLLDGPQHVSSGDELEQDHAELVRQLTRDPDQLLRTIRSTIADAGVQDPSDTVAFHVVMRWIVDPTVPSDLRAAMLRSLQGVSGVDDALVANDVLGRQGIVLGHLDASTGVRDQYVLDPSSGTLLESRAFTTSYLDPACPPGTVTAHTVYDEQGDAVAAAEAPWVNWPVVVDACAPRALVSS